MLVRADIPERRRGQWAVRQFTVSEADEEVSRLRSVISFGSRGRFVPQGTYTGLYRGATPVMTDTPDEIRDHRLPIYEARRRGGHVLLNGLGLGVVVQAILQDEEPAPWNHEAQVERVTVVEIDPDVIELVAPYLEERFHPRLEVVRGDALTWQPPKGRRYSVAWHDIWDNICGDNMTEMIRLHRRYARRADWQGSWCREECRRLR
jgi:hypothetical protein